ncbi:elongation factor tu [Brenneria corticis]|uniref:Elongation factor tu n=2 Tax=Brenneria TaxID=71655 RepID=A0A2U1UDM6_9GAMM|nr:elongation factor tu [Brenneria sp. CFCC 11842]PWC19779.1 elongation factor tu [Brenneria nigrifluens] [Brenneria nigrifluens DSM 30175 = ATCC 13028]QCR06454.1 elongation factor tu [Brenneria nigrifluens] [Brenneria nigrifluens DSM 30175 = ATCC 13028]
MRITFDATRDKRASFDALFLRCHAVEPISSAIIEYNHW